MAKRATGNLCAFLGALLAVVALTSCESVSSEKIQRWKTTQKGPDKLEAALRDAKIPAQLRAEAAVALGEIELAEKVDQTMAALPAAERWEILKSLIPMYIERLKDPSVPKARDARDALFSVRQYAPPEEQKQIDAALLPALEKDLREGRFTGGRHSLDKILSAIGPAASPLLVKLIQDPNTPYGGLADLLMKVGDDASREQAGAALVKRATGMPEIPPAMWKALGSVGGREVNNFLIARVEKGWDQDGVQAAQAMQQRRDPQLLAFAMEKAGDAGTKKAVRDEMFGVIEKIGGLEAQRGLTGIIASDPDEVVRYRAYEAALVSGGVEAIVPALEAFPTAASYKREDVVDFLVKDITKLGATAKPAALKALGSASPLARMTGVLALEAPISGTAGATLGGAADAAAVLKLAADKGTVKGFPAGSTVGKEASRVAGVLQKQRG